MSGYHIREIKKGKFGHISKIEEELEELKDAWEQKARIMILCELADMYGAMEAFLEMHYDMRMTDIAQMSNLTRRAFEDGTRVSKQD